jgi:putative cell wall-binding protein
VPYSQAKYATVSGVVIGTSSAGIGYRTDCSGFLSMCWNLRTVTGAPLNLDTAGLDAAYLVQPISKDSLDAGDMMLKAKDKVPSRQGHAVLFVAWADPAHKTFYTYEESGSGVGAVKGLRTYDKSWADGFRPYRYRKLDPDFADVELRVSGLDRYETAVAAVDQSFPASTTVSVPTVIVASGETWPDALGGSALAGAYEGPLLLTARDSLPAATRASIARLKPNEVFVLGGPGTVSPAVESQLASMGATVTRIGGNDRYEVSRAVARAALAQARYRKRTVDTAYLATGLNFPDALAASPISTKTRRPILLTTKDSLPAGTLESLQELRITKVIILGGEGSVSAKVAEQLKSARITVTRIGGANRYEAAIGIAHHGLEPGIGMSWASLGLASGDAYADALSGGVAQGQTGDGALILLTQGARLTDPVARELTQHKDEIGLLRVFGGSATVQQATRASAATILRAP